MGKEKITSVLSTIGIIVVIAGLVLWYPWFISVDENKEAVCTNFFGYQFSCK